jgi:hypothetical protein
MGGGMDLHGAFSSFPVLAPWMSGTIERQAIALAGKAL